MLTVLVDMDGCIVDLLRHWLRVYNNIYHETTQPSDMVKYDIGLYVKHNKMAFEMLDDHEIFKYASPHGDLEGFRKLYRHPDIDCKIVTHVHKTSKTGFRQKLEWLEIHCPDFDLDKVTFTKEKHAVSGDILIEDVPANMESWAAKHPKGILIKRHAAYNHDFVHPQLSQYTDGKNGTVYDIGEMYHTVMAHLVHS